MANRLRESLVGAWDAERDLRETLDATDFAMTPWERLRGRLVLMSLRRVLVMLTAVDRWVNGRGGLEER